MSQELVRLGLSPIYLESYSALGEAVASALSETYPVPVLRVGVADTFGRSGKVPPLLEMYGLTSQKIYEKAKAAIALKK